MRSIKILRQLWRHKLLVVAVGLVATIAGMVVMFKLPSLQSRSYVVSVATGQILLDTPDSQVVAVSPKGSDTLGVRAGLIASLMVGGTVESAIAQHAGLSLSQLGGKTGAATQGPALLGGSSPVSSATPSGPDAYVLTTNTLTDNTNNPLPIIQFTAQAPNSAAALRLANATITGLREYLDSKAATERIPDAGRMRITGIGAPQVTTQTRGPTALVAILVVLFVFALGCAAIVGLPMLARSWRAAGAFEEQERDPARAPDGTLGLDSILGGEATLAPDYDAGLDGVRNHAHESLVSAAGSNGSSTATSVDQRPLTTRLTEALAEAPTDSDVAQRERSEPEAIVPPARRSRAAKRV